MARSRWILLAVPIVALAVFGTVHVVGGGSSSPKKPRAIGTVTASPTAAPSVSKTVDPFKSTSPAPTGSPTLNTEGPCAKHVIYSELAGNPGGAYIRGTPNNERRWGPECLILNAGDDCYVGWNVVYSIPAGDAYILFQGWAKGAKTPFREITLGPVAGNNSFHDVGFRVKIPKTSEVAFRLVVENDKKVPLAVGDSYLYKVDCKAVLGG